MKNNFFKDNSQIIGKLIRTHLVMSIFGLMVFVPFNLDNASMKAFLIAGSVCAIILYLFLIDVDMWYFGAEDRIRVQAGREKLSPFKGLLIGLSAQIPSIVIGILYAVASMLWAYYQAYPSGSGFYLARAILWFISFLWNGMYLGTERGIFGASGYALFYVLIPLIPVLFSGLTYFLGLINSRFLKPPAKEKKKK